jgi:hypothetical protein
LLALSRVPLRDLDGETRAYYRYMRPALNMDFWAAGLQWINVILQSALLATSLLSIDEQANSIPPSVAISMAVGGVGFLAAGTYLLLQARTLRGLLRRQVKRDHMGHAGSDEAVVVTSLPDSGPETEQPD